MYWLIDTAPCHYCKTDLPPYPIIGLAQIYNQLPIAQDEQRNGGLLCRCCKEEAICIHHQIVNYGQPYVIQYLHAVVFQLVLGFGIVIVLKASFKTICMDLHSSLLCSDSYLLDTTKNIIIYNSLFQYFISIRVIDKIP